MSGNHNRTLGNHLREFACNSRHLGPRRVKKGGSKTRAEHHFGIWDWLTLTDVDCGWRVPGPFCCRQAQCFWQIYSESKQTKTTKRKKNILYEENKQKIRSSPPLFTNCPILLTGVVFLANLLGKCVPKRGSKLEKNSNLLKTDRRGSYGTFE